VEQRRRGSIVPSLHEGRAAAVLLLLLLLVGRLLRVLRRVAALLGVAGGRVALRRGRVAGRRVARGRVAVLPRVT
jgi:hypothetical protein